ncbi:MFS transporter [Streptomyces cylindrosporus]|uniref:MFS transporter n=1 Tax=Streptomyces cylindrosporus TaxID=2927583 RepID=A0ABS9YQD2_9ACTN|nr:MFS transporter [Streptomyces cylindrosporus]MCI3278831.1 MFS transporter [Streptomyces cylindrosporus]
MAEARTAAPPAGAVVPDPRRWQALIYIAVAQLMVSVDSTIVNIALPSAQRALDISDSNRQWVVTAYMLAFGGLLLLGGRISDTIGRKRAFLIGVIGFGLASALGGIAMDAGMLLTARALQGAFGALLAPAGLSLLAVTFTEPGERAKAFGVFSAIAGSGSAVGLILGGVLTEYLNWRWSLFVNVAFALVVVAGALAVVHDEDTAPQRQKLDIAGALLSVAGVVALVYGFTLADTEGWTATPTLSLFVACAVLLTLFVVVEKRTAGPLLPLRIVTERNRAGVFASQALAVITMFGLLLFLTYYFQEIRGYSPLMSGVAFLPMVAGMLIGAGQFASRMMPRMAPRWIMAPGFLVAALGMLLLTQLDVDSSYPLLVLPGQLLFGIGLGLAFTPSMSLATHGVDDQETGVASAMINASQQLGGSIGTALLNTIAASTTASWLASHGGGAGLADQAAVHGYATAVWWTVGILLLAGLVVLFSGNLPRPEQAEQGTEGAAAVHM